jgi:hypothetical protein
MMLAKAGRYLTIHTTIVVSERGWISGVKRQDELSVLVHQSVSHFTFTNRELQQ